MRRNKGFTLIELLVVIAIIAILAAILFPVFAQAREKARSTACLSNQKNIATGIILYSQDYDDNIIQTIWRKGYSTQPVPERLWTTNLQPYLRSGGQFPPAGVFKCPSWSEERFREAGNLPGCSPVDAAFVAPASGQEIYSHYGMANAQLNPVGTGSSPSDYYFKTPGSGMDPFTGQVVTVNLSQVLRPADTALVSDGVTMSFLMGSRRILSSFGCTGALMHHEGSNYVFLDGHAKFLKGNAEQVVVTKQTPSGPFYYSKYFAYDQD